MSSRAVAIFHDVGLYRLWPDIFKVLRVQRSAEYRTYMGRSFPNEMGTGFAYWGFPAGTFDRFGPLVEFEVGRKHLHEGFR